MMNKKDNQLCILTSDNLLPGNSYDDICNDNIID